MKLLACISWYYLTNRDDKNQAGPFLDSLRVLRTVQPWIVCLDFKPDAELRSLYPHCNFVHSDVVENSLTRFTPTDGFAAWLPTFPDAGDHTVVLQTDADVVVQRDFADHELSLVTAPDTICIGPNAGNTDNLAEEASRVRLKAAELAHLPCYNGGNVIATVGTFKGVKARFDAGWDEFCKTTDHRSRSQFYLCKTIHETPGLKVIPMPRTLHCHGHFGLPHGAEYKYGKLFYEGETVMFRHNL